MLQKIGVVVCYIYYLIAIFIKRHIWIQTIDDLIEQTNNFLGDLEISATSLHKELFFKVECNEKGYFELFLESASGNEYTIESFNNLLSNIRCEYGNINVYVNNGGTSLKEKFDKTGQRYVYLTNDRNDLGYL